MPTAVLSNISTRLGIVNGALDKATGVVPDPAGMLLEERLVSCQVWSSVLRSARVLASRLLAFFFLLP
jgi:hypothetical protein